MNELDRFEATAHLDDDALRALLLRGRPEQRVWAAWRLALRTASALPHLVQHVGSEPSAGVRRSLLVVLMGHGEIDVVVELARHDPADEVRTQALQFVATLVMQGALPAAILVDTYAAGPSAIREAILGLIPSGAPSVLQELVAAGLASDVPGEQLEGFEAAVRTGAVELRAAAMRWLAAASGELATEGWMRLQRLPAAEVVDCVIRTNDPKLHERTFKLLTGIPLAALAPLGIKGNSRTFKPVRDRSDFPWAPPVLLARAILAGCAHGFLESLAGWLSEDSPELTALKPQLRDHVITRLAAIAENRYLPDERPAYRWHARAHYQRVLDLL